MNNVLCMYCVYISERSTFSRNTKSLL